MRRIGIAVIVLTTILMITSCRRTTLEPRQYVDWVKSEKNGLKVKKQVGDFSFTVQYKPCEFIAAMEKKDPLIKKQQVDERLKELGGMQYYTLTISSNEKKEVLQSHINSEEEYYNRLAYLASDAEDDISLIQGGDTLPCKLYHFERDYGLAPAANIMLGFELPKNTTSGEDRTLYFDDRVFGAGRVFITIKASDILSIPKMQTF